MIYVYPLALAQLEQNAKQAIINYNGMKVLRVED